jgi:ABC-type sulfate transport system permease component
MQFILLLTGFTVFVFILVPLLKIFVMASVFGWEKTKELLTDPDWSFPTHKSIREKLGEVKK